jgi:peptide/nickel transport system permease protein
VKHPAALALLAIVLACAFAPWIAPHDPDRIDIAQRLAPFSLDHVLGTDHLGRDVFSRLLHGGRSTVTLALLATAATLGVGIVYGAVSGYVGGRVDDAMQWIVLLFQGLPRLSFMLAIAGTLGPGAATLFIAVVVTSWADFSRLARAETLRIREEPYVEAARALGAGHAYVMAVYVVPNLIGPMAVLFTVEIARMILEIAALSFLGLGLQPPQADWGVMIADARAYFRAAPHLMIAPGLCIVAVSLAVNVLGDRLRDRLDSRMDKPAFEL